MDLSSFALPSHVLVGDRVETSDQSRGSVQFVGEISELGHGIFVGINLDSPVSRGNDGSIESGDRYFQTSPGHGVFEAIQHVNKIESGLSTEYANNNDQNNDNNNNNISSSSSNNNNNNNNKNNNDIQNHSSNDSDGYNYDTFDYDLHSSDVRELSSMDEISRRLQKQLRRRPSQYDLESQGVVPPNYFSNPMQAIKAVDVSHKKMAHNLSSHLENRPSAVEIEAQNVVPNNYFADPLASAANKGAEREIIASQLTRFHEQRPTLDELALKNIIPQEFIDHEPADALQIQAIKQLAVSHNLKNCLSHEKRPTITDLGDMHIIPHEYLDHLLSDAMSLHQRKVSRMGHVQNRLEKHLPSPVAHTLAHTLVSSVQDQPRRTFGADHKLRAEMQDQEGERAVNEESVSGSGSGSDSDEWQISFVYNSPMESFVPMDASQKTNVKNTLERRLSLRPSQEQLEIWGFVPPQYFDSPQQSFLRQALGREIALDLLEGFLPNRENISELTDRGIMHYDFVGKDHQQAMEEEHQRKQSVIEELNEKLDPRRRPSVMDLGDAGLIPENWLLDLYGLADEVRRRHLRMDSAVADLKSHLNVPPVLADVVARDLLDEIETVDPYLDQGNNMAVQHQHQNQHQHQSRHSSDMNMNMNDNDSSSTQHILNMNQEMERMQIQLSELQLELSAKSQQIGKLQESQRKSVHIISEITNETQKMNECISDLENENCTLKQERNDLQKNVSRLQSQQMSEMQRLDWKATEVELNAERLKTKQMREEQSNCVLELQSSQRKVCKLESDIKHMELNKIALLNQTTEQMNTLRSYIVSYQRFYKIHTRNVKNVSYANSFISKIFS